MIVQREQSKQSRTALGAAGPRRTRSLWTWGLALALGASACDEGEEEEPAVIELFSWWVAPGEAEALAALLDVHAEHHPNVTVTNAAASNSDTARDRLEQRFAQGFPPDTFQANGGADLLSWVLFNDKDASQSKLEGLGWFFEEEGLYDVIPPAVIDVISYGGEPYAVPMNIHRNNSLFFNAHVLEEHDLVPPSSFEELLTTCETLAEADVPCFAIGGRDHWALALLVWENVMLSSLGAEYHEAFFAGERDPADPELETLLDDLLAMWAFVDPAAFQTTWSDAVGKVGRGEAAFTVMGDWAKGMLKSQGYAPGADFGQVAFPGTEGSFVFATDTFPLALGGKSREPTVELLRVIASTEGQVAFNTLKGSIPARIDAPPDEFDVLGQEMMMDFRQASYHTPAPAAPADFALDALIAETLQSGDRQLLLNAIRDYYDVLRE